jgi:hypothetical protein
MEDSQKQKIREAMLNKCLPQCWRAKSKDCNCVCGGKNHGMAVQENGTVDPTWKPKSENKQEE